MPSLRAPRFHPAVASAVAIAVAFGAARAGANGRFPASGQIAIDPSNEDHILLRATYGLLVTDDHGGRWSWLCEAGVGYGSNEDPMVAVMNDGTLIAGLLEGLSVSTDRGCDWAFAPDLAKQAVVDVAPEKAHPDRALALVSSLAGTDAHPTRVWRTTDDGRTWSAIGTSLPNDFAPTTLDGAPSDSQRIYAAGLAAPSYAGAFERSADGGATWTRPTPPWSDSRVPYVGGVQPDDPNRVYVRMDQNLSGLPDTLEASDDGGNTWTTVYTAKGHLYGFAISPDGSQVALGGDLDGVRVAQSSTLVFEPKSNVGAKCLTWTSSGLYACADELVDGFELGVSTDGGATFSPLARLRQACPLACAGAASVGPACEPYWSRVALTLGATCGYPTPPSADAGGDGADAGGDRADTGSGSGCACASSRSAQAGGALAMSAIAAAAAVARRRRRRRRR